jgi:hypothetical protein
LVHIPGGVSGGQAVCVDDMAATGFTGSGVGWVNHPVTDNQWHNAPKQGGPQYIGHLLPDRPTAILIRAYVGIFDFCRIILRPYDLCCTG